MQTTTERDIFGKVLGVLFILSSLPTVGQYSQAPLPIVLGLAVLAYLHRQRVVRLLDAPEQPAAR